jgi:hypothetical protein
MNDQKKFKKRKDREKKVREKMLRRREGAMKAGQQLKIDRAWENKVEKESLPVKIPYRNKLKDKDVKKRLEHNLKVLKALEEEYERETGKKNMDENVQKALKDINAKLLLEQAAQQGNLPPAMQDEASKEMLSQTGQSVVYENPADVPQYRLPRADSVYDPEIPAGYYYTPYVPMIESESGEKQ